MHLKPSFGQTTTSVSPSQFLNNLTMSWPTAGHINAVLQQTDHLLLIRPRFHINRDPAVNSRPAHMKAIALGVLSVSPEPLEMCWHGCGERLQLHFKDTKVGDSKSQSVLPAASELSQRLSTRVNRTALSEFHTIIEVIFDKTSAPHHGECDLKIVRWSNFNL